ncbi:hypothetical protein Vadar_033034 [Vaccinium darrowii]|uniref:Uncharacterized protein n=1 Tax=Vaccinium darrowii TaxID=229202 RepID=A0ACB7YAD1_9ERIC|nr:hypothetical protein Vadar_033034 [Vaccinium darrowii]
MALKPTHPHLHHPKPKTPTPHSLLPPKGSTKEEFKQVFLYFDTDGNRKVLGDEPQAYFSSMGDSMSSDEAERVIAEFDKDGDNLLEFGEFLELMEGENEGGDDIRRAFEMFEVEKGSGCITPKGLQQVLHRLGEQKSCEDCAAMIRAFDLDGNGVLDLYEFNKMMTPMA